MTSYTSNYYTTTDTTGGSWNVIYDNRSVQYVQANTPQQVFVTDYRLIFKLFKEILKYRPVAVNEGYDLQLMVEKLKEIVKMEKDLLDIGVSEQAMMKVARCMTFGELDEFLREPEEDNFEDEFGPFRLEDAEDR